MLGTPDLDILSVLHQKSVKNLPTLGKIISTKMQENYDVQNEIRLDAAQIELGWFPAQLLSGIETILHKTVDCWE